MSSLANGIGESLAGNTRNRRLTGGVDVGQHQDVGLVKGAAEVVPKVLRAGVAMRLEKDEQAIELAEARSVQCGANLGGVMSVVVYHGDVVQRALDVETAADPGEFSESFADQLRGGIQVERHGCRGCGIAHVVDARRMK